jgi:cell division transport system permease protein
MALRLEYFMSEAFSSLRRNLLMTLAAIFTVALSLYLLGGVMVFSELMRKTVGSWEKMVEVEVFLRDDITPEQSKELETTITAMPEVRGTPDFISKEDALQEFKDLNSESPAIYENVEKDALPASYRIRLKNPKRAEEVSTRLEGSPGVDEVNFGGDDVRKLLTLTTFIRRVVFAIVVIILGAAALLIANTIRLAVYARRKEIAIMKLVGATNWFVRVPFIFEGMVEGAMGALVAGGFVVATKFLVFDGFQKQIPFLPLTVGFDVLFGILALMLLVGMAVGAIGSTLALRRFLEV